MASMSNWTTTVRHGVSESAVVIEGSVALVAADQQKVVGHAQSVVAGGGEQVGAVGFEEPSSLMGATFQYAVYDPTTRRRIMTRVGHRNLRWSTRTAR